MTNTLLLAHKAISFIVFDVRLGMLPRRIGNRLLLAFINLLVLVNKKPKNESLPAAHPLFLIKCSGAT